MQITVLYFAQLADDLGLQSETLTLPEHTTTMAGLQAWLAERGEHWSAIAQPEIRMACNHALCRGEQPINANDEVAFFPPVTGG